MEELQIMLELKSNAPASSLGVHDILTALFKHKWKIITCSIIRPAIVDSQARRGRTTQVQPKVGVSPGPTLRFHENLKGSLWI